MKKLKFIASAIAVIIVISIGLYTPRFISTAFDYHLSKQIKEMNNSSVSLNFSKKADYFERAYYFNRAMRYGYVTDLEPKGNYNLSYDQVKKSIQNIIKFFKLDELNAHSPKIVPILVVYSDNMSSSEGTVMYDKSETSLSVSGESETSTVNSYVFWHCIWSSENGGVQNIFIDDGTGYIVGFSVELSLLLNNKAADMNGVNSIIDYYSEECSIDSMTVEYDDEKGVSNIVVNKNKKKYTYPVFFDSERFYFNLV